MLLFHFSGKFANLEKPFAVLKKKIHVLGDAYNDAIITESTGEKLRKVEMVDAHEVTETSYEVEAVVKNKIIFKNRPRPIIVKPQPKKI